MKRTALLLASLFCVVPAFAQSYQRAKILKWDIEAYRKHGNVTRNAAVYYVQIGSTIYQITRGTTKPDRNLVVGQQVRCRIERDHAFIEEEKRKQVKFSIVGASEAQ